MLVLKVCFVLGVACVTYTYGLYPLIVWFLAASVERRGRLGLLRRHAPGVAKPPRSFSVVIAAFNEEATIGRRANEFLAAIGAGRLEGELIIVSDGSSDRTAAAARDAIAAAADTAAGASAAAHAHVIELPVNRGKAVALNVGCAGAVHEVVVFADSRQTWSADALERLMENFADPTVGAVSGELVVDSSAGVMEGVGLYWRYEKWLRRHEGRMGSMIGVTGAISAVRRELFEPIPEGTILDDVYWPLRVAMRGYRVIHEERAVAYDRLPARARDEFRRKVRTLSGNYQLVAKIPSALLPWRNPVWFQLVSHKLLRLLVPWILMAVAVFSAVLTGWVYRFALWGQVACYGLALAGFYKPIGGRSRAAAAAASFVVLNAAAFVAFWVWVGRRENSAWGKVAYQSTSVDRGSDAILTTSPGGGPLR
jgi:cellulose synthase/poly-beta-1,6-N-acetylglucosamine synthase-like glycosyltransferase